MNAKYCRKKGEFNAEKLLFWIGALLGFALFTYFAGKLISDFLNSPWGKELLQSMKDVIECTHKSNVVSCISLAIKAILKALFGSG